MRSKEEILTGYRVDKTEKDGLKSEVNYWPSAQERILEALLDIRDMLSDLRNVHGTVNYHANREYKPPTNVTGTAGIPPTV